MVSKHKHQHQTTTSQTRRRTGQRGAKEKGSSGTRQSGGASSMGGNAALDTLNRIIWDVTHLPERAVWNGKTAAENRNILERVIHKGSIRLLLPIVKNTSEANNKQMVTYAVLVKGRETMDKEIRFGDILHKIHGFYMGTKVSEDDIAYASMGDAFIPLKTPTDRIRFANFVEGQTTFAGLLDQGKATYLVTLQ